MAMEQCTPGNCSCEVPQNPPVNLPIPFKPRGSLARALYEKQIADDYFSSIDKDEWYKCDLTVLPEELSSKFIQLGLDEDTNNFIKQSEEKSDWILTQLWHSIVKTILGFFMTQTSINGWLERGSMFVVSYPQFLKLLGKEDGWRTDTLLDLGAGDGKVTACLAKSFDKVYATEMSGPMQNLLRKRGYEVLKINGWQKEKKYNVISCLNLLDRCDKPLELLGQIRESLADDGRVLIALVLPFSPYIESGRNNHKPSELMPVKGPTFEKQVESFIKDILEPQGFELESWSCVPYLCEGDLHRCCYWLDDVIIVAKKSTKVQKTENKSESH